MRCIVTAGPTFEPLDAVRRLTNHSTGTLGSELANHLVASGHQVTLLLGEAATFAGEQRAQKVLRFTTTDDLADKLTKLAGKSADAVFHASAVSDFRFGTIWREGTDGKRTKIKAGKIPTADGRLFGELIPTPKIISRLRELFPGSILIGWKYEIEGSRTDAIRLARQQILRHQLDHCVANGPAYGSGFGIVDGTLLTRCTDKRSLFLRLEKLLRREV
ncbi:MAG: DNA/pantothenate metabolism flavoprotein domain protein [Pedosphaera sp.]|nr:DNA/pantothenate metabolism flavoprotein domain protein [Pedosphaera sp.]